MIVELTFDELAKAKRLADLRNSKNGKVPNRRETRRHSDFEIDYAGILAEIAVAKILGVGIDERFLMGGDDHAPDLMFEGWTVEVKATMYDPPIIKFNHLKDFKSDLVVVGFPKGNEVKIYGGMSKREDSYANILQETSATAKDTVFLTTS